MFKVRFKNVLVVDIPNAYHMEKSWNTVIVYDKFGSISYVFNHQETIGYGVEK